jgi:hypothetical protein
MNIEKEYNEQLNARLRDDAREVWRNLHVLTSMTKESELKDLAVGFEKLMNDLGEIIQKMPKS